MILPSSFNRIEKLLLSTRVETDGFLFLKKKRLLVLTDQFVFVVHNSNQSVRYRDSYLAIMGITASLRIGARNFILHFKDRADEEYVCD